MQLQTLKPGTEHEQVVECIDRNNGYHGIIAIHNTALGPAVGGTRVWPYLSASEALQDVLRLSRSMTYKCAIAGLQLGGGKAVIIADSRRLADRETIFRAHGRFINHFQGRFITGEDVGTSQADMKLIQLETTYVGGLANRSGETSPFTAHGVVRAMQAAAMHRWNSDSVAGRKVAIQGCGHVGYHLALELQKAGCQLVVTDIDAAGAARVHNETGALAVAPQSICDMEADILAPCALGSVLDDETIPRLRVEVICGAANNQLREEQHGRAIERRGIIYVPDYVANAGGVINASREVTGWSVARSAQALEAIYDTTLEVFALAKSQGIPTSEAADRLAQSRILMRS